MPILFTLSWDIIPGNEEEYTDFIAKTFLPETTAMGLIPVGGYYVEVGAGPRVIGVNSCENQQELAGIVMSQRFKDLILKLKVMVYNYRSAVFRTHRTSQKREVCDSEGGLETQPVLRSPSREKR